VTADATRTNVEAKGVFLFELLLMSVITIGGIYTMPDYMRAIDICQETGSLGPLPRNWIARGVAYCSLLISCWCLFSVLCWWARAKTPWRHMNSLYLSGVAYPGIKAWQNATADLIASWADQPRVARLIDAATIGAFFFIGIAWLVLEIELRNCSKCAEALSPFACPSAAVVLTAVPVLIFFVDLRIKFKSRAP
jgi:hypothetical protein